MLQSCNLLLIETVAKQPFSFQVVPFDAPRNHITIHVRLPSAALIICTAPIVNNNNDNNNKNNKNRLPGRCL